MLQTILDWVTITEEDAQDLYKSYGVFEWANVKATELGKNIILANITTMPISKEEVCREEKPSYDNGLDSKDSSGTSQQPGSYEMEKTK